MSSNSYKIAAWSGIGIIAIPILYILLSFFVPLSQVGLILYVLVISLLYILLILGLYNLGKEYSNRMVKNVAIYLMIYGVLFTLLSIIFTPYYIEIFEGPGGLNSFHENYLELNQTYGGEDNIPEAELNSLNEELLTLFVGFFIIMGLLHVGISVFFGIPIILMGVGLRRLRDRVDYSNATGILLIISGATIILFLGYFIYMGAFILEIVLLFNEAKKKRN